MSLSSKLRKESDESYAAKQMHSTQGLGPEQGLAQLNDRQLDNELPSRVASGSDTDFTDDYEDIKRTVAESENDDAPSDAEVEEAKRASWGQPPLPANAEDATTDQSEPMTAYQQPTDESDNTVADADWNRTTSEGGMAPDNARDPDRTYGNS
ncbi:hypothetical protein DYU11_08740 [Fibrisoma montanum]|uniref:Uncharacterized protein n=1 Tax=Fibrisoma montanum TaxID=2305895 RepID=A0A418MF26_9BACT|nr:hypothetical protein [Fibrisoma montanum]RIV25376.1 hypothetical protein DYU11_08740 [Fibrisoma montanum]